MRALPALSYLILPIENCVGSAFRIYSEPCHFSPQCHHRLVSLALLQNAPYWSVCCCPCPSVVYFQQSRLNDVFEVKVISGQKPTRSPFLSQSKIRVLPPKPTKSASSVLPQMHAGPSISVSLLNFPWMWENIPALGPLHTCSSSSQLPTWLILFIPSRLCSNVTFLGRLVLTTPFKMQTLPQPSWSIFSS